MSSCFIGPTSKPTIDASDLLITACWCLKETCMDCRCLHKFKLKDKHSCIKPHNCEFCKEVLYISTPTPTTAYSSMNISYSHGSEYAYWYCHSCGVNSIVYYLMCHCCYQFIVEPAGHGCYSCTKKQYLRKKKILVDKGDIICKCGDTWSICEDCYTVIDNVIYCGDVSKPKLIGYKESYNKIKYEFNIHWICTVCGPTIEDIEGFTNPYKPNMTKKAL